MSTFDFLSRYQMSCFKRLVVPSALALCALPFGLEAQHCLGLPAASGITIERGITTLGSSLGAAASVVGNRVALRLAGAKAEVAPTFDGFGGDLRLAVQQRVSRLSLCPLVEMSYLRATQDRAGLTTPAVTGFTSQTAAVRGGVSVGMMQQLPRGFAVIPFVAARYEFSIFYLDPETNSTAGEAEAAGDTLSAVDVAYGATVAYKRWHAGWFARRSSERPGRAHVATIFVGFAWGNPSRKE